MTQDSNTVMVVMESPEAVEAVMRMIDNRLVDSQLEGLRLAALAGLNRMAGGDFNYWRMDDHRVSSWQTEIMFVARCIEQMRTLASTVLPRKVP